MKKVLLFLVFFNVIIALSSCNKKESKSVFVEFSEKYYELNKDSYDPKEKFYSIESNTTYISFDKTIYKTFDSKFDGKIDFRANSFDGVVSDFRYEYNYLMLKNENVDHFSSSVMNVVSNSGNQKISNLDGISQVNNLEILNNILIKTNIDDSFFKVSEYETMLQNQILESVSVKDNKVMISKKEVLNDSVVHTNSIFYLDSLFNIVTINQTTNITFNRDSKTNPSNIESIIKNTVLEVTKEKEIIVPTFGSEILFDNIYSNFLISI